MFHSMSEFLLADDFDMRILDVIFDWMERGHFPPGEEVLRQMQTFCEDHAHQHELVLLLKKLQQLQQEVHPKKIIQSLTSQADK